MTERVCKAGPDCDVMCYCVPCRACFDHCSCLDDEPAVCEAQASIPESSVARDDDREPDTTPPGEGES